MAGKPRVHEIAAELGVDSKIALAKLKELGEFVKSPSSTIEPPVARKLRAAIEADGSLKGSADAAPAAKPAAAKPAAAKPGAKPAPTPPQARSEACPGSSGPRTRCAGSRPCPCPCGRGSRRIRCGEAGRERRADSRCSASG